MLKAILNRLKIKPKAEEIISKELAGFIATMSTTDQGPVVQSIVSLTSSLRGQLFKCFMTSSPNTLIFFIEKMRVASTKNNGIFQILTFEILTKR